MLCFSLGFITASNLLSQTDRGMKTITVHTKKGKPIELYKASYALVVGNGNYTNGWDPLDGALKDVTEVEAVLKKHGFRVTLKKDLTRAKFDRAFAEFVLKSGEDRNNRLLFYYAGHGYTRKSATDEALGYLVMVDAPAPEKDKVGFELESISMESLVTQAEKILARHALFIFDSCFSGTILNARDQLNRPESISDSVRYPVRQFITAGRAGEIVPDHSDFKQAFLDLLEGRADEPFPDGYITGEELGYYLKHQVPVYNPTQHPQYGRIRNPKLDKGDFVFVLPKEKVWIPPPEEHPTIATLTVTSTPSGADIYIDDVRVGTTPLQGYQIDTGVRRVKAVKLGLSLSGYQNHVVDLTLNGGQRARPLDVRLEKVVSQIATLKVTSTPRGATVYVEGAQIGKTPLTDYKVDTGVGREKQIEVGLELSGYKSRVAKLTLKGDQQTPWEVRLEKIPQMQKATLPSDTALEGMVLIPAGPFRMGSNDSDADDDEKPVHTVKVDAFYMDTYEVTVGQYKRFVRETGHIAPDWNRVAEYSPTDQHPMICVNWYDAMAYAKWAGKRLPTEAEWEKAAQGDLYAKWAGKRLPTEAEWEKAAQGGLVGRKYPWGNSIDSSKANYNRNVGNTTPVGSYAPNGYGLYDMVGNVWEWCLDAYDSDFYKIKGRVWSLDQVRVSRARVNPIGGRDSIAHITNNFTNVKTPRVLRGGSWINNPGLLRVANRYRNDPSGTVISLGFRCARAQ